ncbi:PadR family transcriptional regulator [Paenibacillus sp. JDR-2]|uniref:PadR family transcriptional regulator n=1 Tax=Paenibacillus sp. (strain JDR-2) TaxID=324057 RepID=UPI00016686D1|nr:PadR family transcriptional regulator [Paenibacillus sp. JDR-2]ACT01400.1 transcriptional regulator, PadR-like family [Paenibacillus sp. JDR-2]
MSMKLLILGLLMERDRHPYDIRQTIKQRNWNESFRLRDGSLYYAVDQLRDHALIETAEIVAVPGDNRPDKTIYRITESGKEAFHKLLYEQLSQVSYPQHPVFLALAFIRHGDQGQTEQLLQKQLAACEERIKRMEAVLDLKGTFLPTGSRMMINGIKKFGEAEKEWLLELLELVRSGSLFQGPSWTPEQIEQFLKSHPGPQMPEK